MKPLRLIAVIIAVVIALSLSGCGGSPPTAEQISQTALQPAGQTTTTAEQATGPLRKPIELPSQFKVDKSTPKFMVEALQTKKPILIFIFKENHNLSLTVRESIKKVLSTPMGNKILFLALNVDKSEHVAGLVDRLGVTSIPFLALIDENGMIVKEYSGYIDEKTLEQAVYNLVGGIPETTETTEVQGSD